MRTSHNQYQFQLNINYIIISHNPINQSHPPIYMSQDLTYFTTALISSISLFSLYKIHKTQTKISQYRQQIHSIQSSTIKSADDTFIQGETAIVKGFVNRNVIDVRNDRIVRRSQNGRMDQYVVYIKFKESIYSNQDFTNKEQYVIDIRSMLGKADIVFSPSFLLSGVTRSIVIQNYDKADYSPMLQIQRWDNRKKRLNLSEKFQVLMLSYFRALGTLVVADRGRPGYLRGIDIGTREVETGLKVGSSILALGTIVLSSDGKISLQPNLLFKDRLSIVANLQDVTKGYEDSRNFWLVVLIVGGIYIGRRIYKYNQKHDIISKIKRWWNKQPQTGNKPVRSK